ncbi:hypothetical protein PV327_003057 [Microctonus hyperodae]|uniref:Uncharacterized protein n=1 Tax=Microctonus hyperodae TaxID=165561 RepID=A0AA39L0N4_MICHY|nr:hypothetical protein PV327_003057 [Microctonus hyperodae]
MENLWYNLSPNVLEEMIKFAPRSKYEDCPKFILEIEAVTSSMNRYVMNLIDKTRKTIFCVSSAEYSKKFPTQDAIAGKIIQIIDYWLFDIETDLNSNNMYEHQYVIMISNAEIMKLSPTTSIGSLTQTISKSLRMRGIVDSCLAVSYANDGRKFLRFCLRDNTGSIGCTAWGVLSTLLEPHLNEGVKLEISHGVIHKVDPGYKICDNDFELKLNQFSKIKIHDSDNLSVIYTHPTLEINETKLPDTSPVTDLSINQPTIPIDQSTEFKMCSNGAKPIPINSLTNIGVCTSWIRGIIDSHTGIATTRINTVFTRLQLHDHTTAIMCTVWEPICRPLSAIIKEGMIVEILHANVRPATQLYKISDFNFEIYLTKFTKINVLTSDGLIVYQYGTNLITNPQKEIKSQSTSNELLKQKFIDGKLPHNIDSLTKEGFCISWIRGIMENHAGLSFTRNNRAYTRFYLRDNTGVIHCTVWEPICTPLNQVLKAGLILEILNCKVSAVKNRLKLCNHKYEIYLNEFSSIKVFTPDDNLVYEHLSS